jgi:hypothetical protein
MSEQKAIIGKYLIVGCENSPMFNLMNVEKNIIIPVILYELHGIEEMELFGWAALLDGGMWEYQPPIEPENGFSFKETSALQMQLMDGEYEITDVVIHTDLPFNTSIGSKSCMYSGYCTLIRVKDKTIHRCHLQELSEDGKKPKVGARIIKKDGLFTYGRMGALHTLRYTK